MQSSKKGKKKLLNERMKVTTTKTKKERKKSWDRKRISAKENGKNNHEIRIQNH
jgi:hypothetical protein